MAGRRTTVPPVQEQAQTSAALDELTTAPSVKVVDLPVARLHPHPDNPRRTVGDVTDLAADIAANGVDQPLTVVPDPDHDGDWRVVIGHRRLAALIKARLQVAPARVRTNLSPAQQRQMMVRENIHRQDLTPVEEADAYQAMLSIDGLKVASVAKAVSRSQTHVRSRLKIANSPDAVRSAVHAHQLSIEDALLIADLPAGEQAPVLKAIGTPNFTQELTAARRSADLNAKAAPILARLAEAGATCLKRNDYGTPDGLTLAGAIDPNRADAEQLAERTDEFLTGLAAGWAWRWYFGNINVYRPLTLDEATDEAARQAERDTARADREAAEEARRAARAQRAEFSALTATMRADFLAVLIAGRLSSPHQVALGEFVATMLTSAPWINWDIEPGPMALARWLGVDLTQASAAKPWERRDLLEEPVADAVRKFAWPNQLLAALAAIVEGSENENASWYGEALVLLRAWYALLEQLGYVVSDAERAALEPKPEQDTPPAAADQEAQDDPEPAPDADADAGFYDAAVDEADPDAGDE